MHFMELYFHIFWSGSFCISEFFVDPTHNVNYKGKQNSDSKSQDEKTQFESKRHKSDY